MTKSQKRQRQKPDESASFTEKRTVALINDDKAHDGLTLKQAAFIYFGGMALFIAGMVVAGLAT